MPVDINTVTEYGDFTYGRDRLTLWTTGGCPDIFITGKFCSLGWCLRAVFGDHDASWVSTYPFGYEHKETFPHNPVGMPLNRGNIVIGNDVFVGNFATFMSGVHVGDGAIIAAGAHVVKNVEPYTIVGGNPAKLIKKRFTDEQIHALLKIKWWDWPVEKIREAVPLLSSPNIQNFIDKYLPEICQTGDTLIESSS